MRNAGIKDSGAKGVFEIFGVNEEIEEMIYHNVSIVELRKKPGNGNAIDARGRFPKCWPESRLWTRC